MLFYINFLFVLLFFCPFFQEVILSSDEENFDIKERIALFQRSTKNEKAKEMEKIEHTVRSQIDEALGHAKFLLNNKSPEEEENDYEFGTSSSSKLVNLTAQERRESVNPFRISTRRANAVLTVGRPSETVQAKNDHRLVVEFEKEAINIKQAMSAQNATTNEQLSPLSVTRKTLHELRKRLDKVGAKVMKKVTPAEPSRPSWWSLSSPKDNSIEKRKIERQKALNNLQLLMECLVVNMEKLYVYSDHTRAFDQIEIRLLSESLRNVKQANDRPLKSHETVAALLSNALRYFDQYKAHRAQSGKDHEYSDDENIISEDETEMEATDFDSAKADQFDDQHWNSSTEQSDNDVEPEQHDTETILNDTGSDYDETIDLGTPLTTPSDLSDQSETDQSDYEDGSSTDAQYHSEIIDPPASDHQSQKFYSSDSELTAVRKKAIGMETSKNRHRMIKK